jgi:Siphovirus-type tail component, C-terminal domain
MLTAVDIINSRSETLSLSLVDFSGGYQVREITGLGPVNAALKSSSMAQVDGAQFQSARRDVRNITMKLGLKPDYAANTVQSLRSGLYDYLLPKLNVRLGFYLDDILFAVTSGQVESFENPMFSQNPEVDVSLLCYDPDFYGPAEEFISDHTQSDNITTKLIQYEGTSDAGFVFSLNIDRTLASFSIQNTNPDGSRRTLEIVGSFIAGDVVEINTIPGSKSVTLTRSGITSSILYYMNTLSTWPFFQKGDNLFAAYASGAAISYDLVYTPKFGGI